MGSEGNTDNTERLSALGKKYFWLFAAVLVALVTLVAILIWAENHHQWYAAQASLLALLLLAALTLHEWLKYLKVPAKPGEVSDEAAICQGAIQKLLIFDAIGFSALLVTATGADHWRSGVVARAIGYGTLVAGAFFVLGVLFGYLFGLRPAGFEQSDGKEKQAGGTPSGPRTNLEEIADWFTKLILGAGLVELTNLREPIGQFATFIASGVDPYPAVKGNQGSPAIALSIMLFFSASGTLYGYLWTRYEHIIRDTPPCKKETPPKSEPSNEA